MGFQPKKKIGFQIWILGFHFRFFFGIPKYMEDSKKCVGFHRDFKDTCKYCWEYFSKDRCILEDFCTILLRVQCSPKSHHWLLLFAGLFMYPGGNNGFSLKIGLKYHVLFFFWTKEHLKNKIYMSLKTVTFWKDYCSILMVYPKKSAWSITFFLFLTKNR